MNSYYSWSPEFDDISSYSDEQVAPKLKAIKHNQSLQTVMEKLFFEGQNKQQLVHWHEQLDAIDNIESFQAWIEQTITPFITKRIDHFLVEGITELDPQQSYIFISNHRDIVMDPLLLNLSLKQHGFATAHCAIGDNLLVSPAANDLARLNHCFKVIRSLKSPKAILKAMKNQSAYIGYRHFVDGSNIWIAQKEGRSKDNSDKTNPALIKMLGLSRPKEIPLSDFYQALNIVPVCYSYEWDPCDVDKAVQLEAESDAAYQKSREEDLVAVTKGLSGEKGSVSLKFGKPIQPAEGDNHTDIANAIDQFIKRNYALYPVNYAAIHKLTRQLPSECPYEKTELNRAWRQLESRINIESESIQKRIIQAYAAPLQ